MIRIAVLVRSTGFYKAQSGGKSKPNRAVNSHLKYIEAQKEKHRNEVQLKDKQGNPIDRREFLEKIKAQKDHGVVAHKLIFSLSEDEAKKNGVNMEELVRDTMTQYEAKHKTQLDYVYALHDDENHPHCHVVVRGRDEKNRSVYIGLNHMREMERYAERSKERMAERQQERSIPERSREQEKGFVHAWDFYEKEQERGYDRER